MAPTPRLERRSLLASLGAGLLIAIAALAWVAFTPRNSPGPPAQESEAHGTTAGPAGAQPMTPLAEKLEGLLRAAKTELPEPNTRSPLDSEVSPRPSIEILVRSKQDATPMPGCEVLYIDAGGEVEHELAQIITRHGLDIGEIRRVGNRTLTDANGRVQIHFGAERLYAMAISQTLGGMESFDTAPSSEARVIECTPIFFLRAQVVDAQGRPQRGIPVCVARKSTGLFDVDAMGTTRGPEGIAELGPIENDEDMDLIVRISGAFATSSAVEIHSQSLPPQPIRLVLPEHGSLEVRLVESDGGRFAGEAEVRLGPSAGIESVVTAPAELVPIRSGIALFQNVGLGLEFQVEVSIRGHDLSYEANAPGPRSAGEMALIDVQLGPASLTLVGRALDAEQRPLRFRELRLMGAIDRAVGALQFDRQASSDAVGNFAIQFDNCALERGKATLLIVHERGLQALGAVKSLAVRRGSNEIGTWILEPAELLASGRVVDSFGEALPGAHVELVNPDRALGIGWAEPAVSGELGRFELRGWSSESTISILAGTLGAKQREPIAVAKGSSDVLLARPAARN